MLMTLINRSSLSLSWDNSFSVRFDSGIVFASQGVVAGKITLSAIKRQQPSVPDLPARRHRVDVDQNGSDRSRHCLEARRDNLPSVHIACVEENQPAFLPTLVFHVCSQLCWTWNIPSLQNFELNNVEQSRRERHQHIHKPDAGGCFPNCRTSFLKFRTGEKTQQFLSQLLGPLPQFTLRP